MPLSYVCLKAESENVQILIGNAFGAEVWVRTLVNLSQWAEFWHIPANVKVCFSQTFVPSL